MALALDPSQRIKFIIESDRGKPEKEQTRFFAKPMSVADVRKFLRRFQGKREEEVSFDEVLTLLEKYLVGWENYRDASGKEVPFKMQNGKPSEDNWEYCTVEVLGEIMNGILLVNKVAEVEAKN